LIPLRKEWCSAPHDPQHRLGRCFDARGKLTAVIHKWSPDYPFASLRIDETALCRTAAASVRPRLTGLKGVLRETLCAL
jgi:hypothetical protein